jgi:hypothetical protein
LPAQELGVVLSVVLMVVLLWRLTLQRRVGKVGGLGLVLGGLAAFLLSMVTQPTGGGWLENGQWIAIGAMIVGVAVLNYRPPPPLSREEAALILERFVLGGGGPHDHEALEYFDSADPLVMEAQRLFVNVQNEFPATQKGHYCNEQGCQVLLEFARRLRDDGE